MNADGTNPVQLTNDPLPEMFPAFSPDGKKIAFVRGERVPGGPQARAKGSGLPSPSETPISLQEVPMRSRRSRSGVAPRNRRP